MKPEEPPYSSLPPLQIAQAIGVSLMYDDALKVHAFINAKIAEAYAAGFGHGLAAAKTEHVNPEN